MERGAWRALVHGVTRSQTSLSHTHTHTHTQGNSSSPFATVFPPPNLMMPFYTLLEWFSGLFPL